MIKYLVAFLLCFFPSKLIFPIVRLIRGCNFTYGKNAKIGFSFVVADEIHLESGACIRHLNLLFIPQLNLGKNARIKYLNVMKGRYILEMDEKAIINQSNKITSRLGEIRQSRLYVGYNSIIGVGHLLDMTHNITIGPNSILAGARSQIWTHGFYHPSSTISHWRIDGAVDLGKNVYVGTSVIINPCVQVVDNVAIGGGAVLSKSLTESGLYVGQTLRFIEFKPEESIKKHRQIAPDIWERISPDTLT